MHDIPHRIAAVLLEVEASLRATGKWGSEKPPASALASAEPFCFDTLSLEQWLQWIFIPRMKHILEHRQPLPKQSAIFEYAQACVPTGDPRAVSLLAQIRRFDELIAIQSGTRKYH